MAKKIKVSQETIDRIKKLGMTESLKMAGKTGKAAGGYASELEEGIRRMYGERRLAEARAKYGPKKTVGAGTVLAPKKPTTTGKSTTTGGKSTTTGGKSTTKVSSKKSSDKSNLIKGVAGTVAALGIIAATKGRGKAAATKLSPAVGKFAQSGVGKALFGAGEQISSKGLSTAGRMLAKSGKPVSQSQYEAMQAAAKAAGKVAAKAPAKTAAKTAGTVTKKRAASAGGATASKKRK